MNFSTAASPWREDWSNAVFSLEERDRRWGKVRALMARAGIDLIVCLPCTNCHDRGTADSRYLTQLGENSDEVTVAFPIEGEVTAWHSWAGIWPSANWFSQDIRAVAARGAGGLTLSNWIEENPRFKTATIAIAGLDASPIARIRETEGEVNWRSVELLRQNFPKARFVSATPVLGEARFRKSAEEIEFLRKATAVAEAELQAMCEAAHEGVPERHVYATMMYANAKAGGSFPPMVGWTSGPQDAPFHRLEQPTFRILQRGDLVSAEIDGRWGGYSAQIDQTIAIGTARPELEPCLQMTYDAFDRVMAKMAPGVTFGELIAAAEGTGMAGRAATGLGLHGRGLGDDGPLLVSGRMPARDVLNMEVAEGCCFVVKPSTALGDIKEFARWSDTIVVTARGAERLGTRPRQFFLQR